MNRENNSFRSWTQLPSRTGLIFRPAILLYCTLGLLITFFGIQGITDLFQHAGFLPNYHSARFVSDYLYEPFQVLFSIVSGDVSTTVATSWLLSVFLFKSVVWGYFGTAVCRLIACELCLDISIGFLNAGQYALNKWPAAFASFLIPGIGFGFFFLINFGVALFLNIPVVNIVVSLCLPLAYASAFIGLLIFTGTVIGHPLFLPTIAVEGTDSFDAISRGFSYVLSRIWRYVGYWGSGVLYAAALTLPAWGGFWLLVLQGHQSAVLPAVEGGFLVVITCVYFVLTNAMYLLMRQHVDDIETDVLFIELSENEFANYVENVDEEDLEQLAEQFSEEKLQNALQHFSDDPEEEPSDETSSSASPETGKRDDPSTDATPGSSTDEQTRNEQKEKSTKRLIQHAQQLVRRNVLAGMGRREKKKRVVEGPTDPTASSEGEDVFGYPEPLVRQLRNRFTQYLRETHDKDPDVTEEGTSSNRNRRTNGMIAGAAEQLNTTDGPRDTRSLNGTWKDVFRLFRVAIHLPTLLLGAVGLASSILFVGTATVFAAARQKGISLLTYLEQIPVATSYTGKGILFPVFGAFKQTLMDVVTGPSSVVVYSWIAVCMLVLLITWSYLGTAMARMAGGALILDRRFEINESLRFARTHFAGTFLSLIPPAMICFGLFAGAAAGYRSGHVGMAIGGLVLTAIVLFLAFAAAAPHPMMYPSKRMGLQKNPSRLKCMIQWTVFHLIDYGIFLFAFILYMIPCVLSVFLFSAAMEEFLAQSVLTAAGDPTRSILYELSPDLSVWTIVSAIYLFWQLLFELLVLAVPVYFLVSGASLLAITLRKASYDIPMDQMYGDIPSETSEEGKKEQED